MKRERIPLGQRYSLGWRVVLLGLAFVLGAEGWDYLLVGVRKVLGDGAASVWIMLFLALVVLPPAASLLFQAFFSAKAQIEADRESGGRNRD